MSETPQRQELGDAELPGRDEQAKQVASQTVYDSPEQLIAPDQFDERFRTTRWEIWAYYACVIE